MTNTVTNVGLLALAMGAVDKGLSVVQTNLVAGIVILVVAIGLLLIYEKYPATPAV
jgi:hypothetical protein